jgi:hypothetical protein
MDQILKAEARPILALQPLDRYTQNLSGEQPWDCREGHSSPSGTDNRADCTDRTADESDQTLERCSRKNIGSRVITARCGSWIPKPRLCLVRTPTPRAHTSHSSRRVQGNQRIRIRILIRSFFPRLTRYLSNAVLISLPLSFSLGLNNLSIIHTPALLKIPPLLVFRSQLSVQSYLEVNECKPFLFSLSCFLSV